MSTGPHYRRLHSNGLYARVHKSGPDGRYGVSSILPRTEATLEAALRAEDERFRLKWRHRCDAFCGEWEVSPEKGAL